MPIICQADTSTPHLGIEGEMTIYTAAQLYAELVPFLALASPLDIDLSQVTEIDGAGLQLLMLAKRETLRTGVALQLSGHSQAVLEVFELCDLAGTLGHP
ncbi:MULTISPECIES: lipid asymmetry maintenance protein MlaB [unclassified Pseudomonas]|uniref:STAS domain-containing protein n=1 Tax=unclassified Pseudomonas TaxID=196821 RepID=UPI00174D1FEE|nr:MULTISPECIES: STAS domain-containing protein [unclassified Pseudomonas]